MFHRVSWSLVASMQTFLSGRKSFYACRALLGLIEGGFIVRWAHALYSFDVADQIGIA
jgi:hypothetical protein